MKGAGLQDTRENCWKFFIDRVRKQLKVNCSYNINVEKNDLSAALCTRKWPLGHMLRTTGLIIRSEKNFSWHEIMSCVVV